MQVLYLEDNELYTKETYIENDYGFINIKNNILPLVHITLSNLDYIITEEQKPV